MLSNIRFSIIVVSTTRSHKTDQVIPCLTDFLLSHKATVECSLITTDKIDPIQSAVKSMLSQAIDVILVSGGTGLSDDDITPEALLPLYRKTLPGFDEIMRSSSFKLTPTAILSRGISGIIDDKIVISLPGSPKAAVENLAFICSALPHAVKKVKGDKSFCVAQT